MTQGIVSSALEAHVTLTVLDAKGNQHTVDVLIDTGYNGDVALPKSLVNSLGLVWKYRHSGILADGSVTNFDVYAASVLWNGVHLNIELESTATTALLGTSLLTNHILEIHFISGGMVQIRPLP